MNDTQVGGIYFDASFDVDAFQKSADGIEKIAQNTAKLVEQTANNLASSIKKPLSNVELIQDGLKNIVKPAAIAATAIAAGFGTAATASFNQVRAVENASFALRAYEKDGEAVNKVLGQLVSYARSDMGVLFQREELFKAASNLKGFGEATSNLNGRVQILSKGVALGMTTFDEFSQLIGRSAQQGQVTADVYDQLASRGIILDQSFRGAKVTAEDLYNELNRVLPDEILAGRANTIDGAIVRLQSSFRDLGATILGVDSQTSQFIEGGLGSSLVSGIVNITNFIKANKEMIIGIGSGIIVFGVAIGVIYNVAKAVAVMRIAFAAAAGPVALLVTAIAALLAIVSGVAITKWVGGLQDASKETGGISDKALDTATNFGKATDEADKLGKQLQKINEQEQKVRSDYRENLAELVSNTKDSIKALNSQLLQEETAYQNTYNKRLIDFQQAQAKEEESHAKKTQRLQTQIDFLRRYDTESNRRKLSELQFTLARENAAYAKQTELRQSEYDVDAQAEATRLAQRQSELQTRLNNETALLEKHRGEVESIRGVILLDEIDKLKRSRDEQLKSLQQQRIDAKNNATGTIADSLKAYTDSKPAFDKAGADMGASIGQNIGAGIIDGVKAGLKAIPKAIVEESKPGGAIDKFFDGLFGWAGDAGKKAKQGSLQDILKKQGFASGGFTGSGPANEVAGVVHKGEYVIPKTMVDQNTGLPMGGGGSSTNITVNLSGIMTDSRAGVRNIANQLVESINEKMRAQSKPQLGIQ